MRNAIRPRFKCFNQKIWTVVLLIPSLTIAASPASSVRPLSSSLPAASSAIVLDPGHGGEDLGAIVNLGPIQVFEKDVALAVAVETARWLRAQKQDVALTREDDRAVSLPDRTALANRLKAKVFVSIHLNAPLVQNKEASGIEFYVLNNTSDASAKRLAHLENSVAGEKFKEEKRDVALILKDLTLDANLPESRRLACSMQSALLGLLKSRGIKQALFHVLLGADMPSALVELGFLTSASDRKVLFSKERRAEIAQKLGQGIFRYLQFKVADRTALNSCPIVGQ